MAKIGIIGDRRSENGGFFYFVVAAARYAMWGFLFGGGEIGAEGVGPDLVAFVGGVGEVSRQTG
jgi:hypothetical protein